MCVPDIVLRKCSAAIATFEIFINGKSEALCWNLRKVQRNVLDIPKLDYLNAVKYYWMYK